MTTWRDIGDMPHELDDFDPTNPFTAGGPDLADPESVDVDLDGQPIAPAEPSGNLFLPDGSPDWERGFGEGSGSVRVWANPEGMITKVRVSTTWREKLNVKGRAAEMQAAALGRAFTTTFGVINIVNDPGASAEPTMTADGPGKEPLTWTALNRIQAQLDDAHERLAAIEPEDGHGRWRGDGATGLGAGGRVKVHLNHRGGYSRVEFAPQWLADSNVGMICNAVPEAAQDALRRFSPPEYEPGERDQLTTRITELRRELSAMMQRGFQ